MKRVVYLKNDISGKDKFVFKKEYEGFDIYNEMCPTGYFVHNSWFITDGDICLRIESYNNYCFDEVLDLIDCYNEYEEFGIRAFSYFDKEYNHKVYYMHPSGSPNLI